jgi:hypothetical protein
MSAGRLLTVGLGTPFSAVKYLVTLGLGTAGTPPVPPDNLPMGGAGYPVDWQTKRRKRTLKEQPEKHLRAILDRVVAEYYGEIVASDAPQAVKAEAGKLVKPFADKQARFKFVPPVAQVDWKALQRDSDAVAAIIRIWSDEIAQRDIDEDDDDILMMMH